MRYAFQGVTPDSHRDLDDAHLERIVAMGYDGVTFHFGALSAATASPDDVSAEDRRRLKLMVDVPSYLGRVASTLTDPWFVVEHVPDPELESAATRLRRFKTIAFEH